MNIAKAKSTPNPTVRQVELDALRIEIAQLRKELSKLAFEQSELLNGHRRVRYTLQHFMAFVGFPDVRVYGAF